jgi:GT2 family glycosyltransferase
VNNDTYGEPAWIQRLVEVGESHPEIGVLGPVQLLFDSEDFNSWTLSAWPHLLGELRERNRPGAWLPVDWVEGSCLVAKREVFERVGRLDPIFFIFFEECDFCRRARAAGFEVAVVPSSRLHHHRGGYFDTAPLSRRKRFFFLRNSMIYNSTDPTASLWNNVGGLLRNNAVQLKDSLLKQRDPAVWLEANCSLVAHLPAVYRKWRTDRRIVGR